MFDVTSLKSLEYSVKWKRDIDSKLPPNFPVILLANKCDLLREEEKDQLRNVLNKFCVENKFVSWFFTSAKQGQGIEEAVNSLVATMMNLGTLEPSKDDKSSVIVLQNQVIQTNRERSGCYFCTK